MSAATLMAGLGLLWQDFSVASVKLSPSLVGKDYGNRIAISPIGFTARNSTLKRLIVEAYQVHPFQVTGGPGWLDTSEYEVEARTDAHADPKQIQAMLRSLLTERFGLVMHRETRELRVYELLAEKNRLKVGASTAGTSLFRGSMPEFCNLLGIKLSIHVMDDPTKPGMAAGPPVPVVDKTGLPGIYEFPIDVAPEPGADSFALWQRRLHELGLKLESRKAAVEMIVVDGAEKVPARH